MNDELFPVADPEEEEEELDLFTDDPEAEPEPPSLIIYDEELVDRERHAAIIHDSFGERYVDVALMRERGGAVTILRALGAMQLEPKGEVQYHLNGNLVGSDHLLNAGDELYIVGKLAGGK